MRVCRIRRIYTLCVILAFVLTSHAFGAERLSSGSMLPDGLIMEEEFKPGIGATIGRILLVQGEVVIIHDKNLTGYLAEKNLSLYIKDNIITLDKGRVRLKLNDGSVLTLASKTTLVLNQSAYEPRKKSRLSFLKLKFGKARFLVRKLVGFARSDFKVKTPTAVVGVRGSDYIIATTEDTTQVTTLDEVTQLYVAREDDPEDTADMEGLQTLLVETGVSLPPAEDISPEEAEGLTQDFTVSPEPEGAVEGVAISGKQKEEEPKEEETEEESAEAEPGEEVSVLVPEDELVEPEEITAPEEIVAIAPVDIIDPVEPGIIEDVVEEIEESLIEEPVITRLPDLPGHP
ncbi:FecR domain-containing protein [Thermodesulfobacteriota bacterium]